jgi:hypothetical protein
MLFILSTSDSITDHADHTPTTTAAPTGKPAKRFLLTRMTFSIGTGEGFTVFFFGIAARNRFRLESNRVRELV